MHSRDTTPTLQATAAPRGAVELITNEAHLRRVVLDGILKASLL